MTIEEFKRVISEVVEIENDTKINSAVVVDSLSPAIEMLEQKCEDYISRSEALRELDNHKYSDSFCVEHNIDWSINLNMAHIILNELKPLSTVIKFGHWIHKNDDYNDWLECSRCGYGSEGEVRYGFDTPYCPMCGMKMEGGVE